jgi:hypothetical protein
MVSVKLHRFIPFMVATALVVGQRTYATVVYTPVNITVTGTGIFKIDLNHDGVTDVSIVSSGGTHVCPGAGPGGAYGFVDALPGANDATVANGDYTLALSSGTRISSSSSFYSAQGFMLQYNTCAYPPHSNLGAWQDVSNHYVGVRFLISGHTHYGWARLSVLEGRSGPIITLTGYAYETVAGAAIVVPAVSATSLTLDLTSPVNNSTITNPVHIAAAASGPNPISELQVWVNYKEVFQVSGGLLNTNVTLPVGSNERLVVQAVDSKGNIAKVVDSITVK